MPIPTNISRDHIIKAISRINNEGVPKARNYRIWAMKQTNKLYPCKLIISWANSFANSEELESNLFIAHEANDYLTKFGFTVINLRNEKIWK
jgi:hypothetical protein